MTRSPEDRPGKPDLFVLDPYAFPSETGGRFQLLMLAVVLTTSLFAYPLIQSPLNQMMLAMGQQLKDLPEVRYDPEAGEAPVETLRRQIRAREAMRSFLPSSAAISSVPFALILLNLSFAAAYYWTHPWRFRREHGGRRLAPDEAPELRELLRSELDHHGVSSDFSLHGKPGGFGLDGRVYGFRGREVIYLPMDPTLLAQPPTAAIACIALHELAHLINRDSQVAERSRALGFGLLLVCLILLPLRKDWDSVGGPVGMKLPLLLTVLAFLWVDLVRTREFFADWRVALRGHGSALADRLGLSAGRASRVEVDRRIGQLARRLARWWRAHPDDSERLEALLDPRRLFRISSRLSFASGFLLSWVLIGGGLLVLNLLIPTALLLEHALETILPIIDRFLPLASRATGYRWAAFGIRFLFPAAMAGCFLLAVSHLVTKTLGVQVVRAAIADLDSPPAGGTWGYGTLWWPAAAMATGLEAGLFLMAGPARGLYAGGPPWLPVCWVAAFAALSWLWLGSNHATARLLLALRSAREPPRWSQRLLSASTTVLLALILWPVLFGRLTTTLHVLGERGTGFWKESGLDPQQYVGDEQEFFVVLFIAVSLLLVVTTIAGFLVWALVLLTLSFLLALRTRECSICGQPTHHRRRIGRRCSGCKQPLAPWAYVSRRILHP